MVRTLYDLYAVKLLFESTTKPRVHPGKTFEERIIIVKTKNRDQTNEVVYKRFPPDTYENSEGGVTTVTLAKVLDLFELVENPEESLEFTEVYSRYLLFDEDVTAEQAIETYSLDK